MMLGILYTLCGHEMGESVDILLHLHGHHKRETPMVYGGLTCHSPLHRFGILIQTLTLEGQRSEDQAKKTDSY